MTPHLDSLAALPPGEQRALILALLARAGGEITLTEDELWRAHRDTRVIQIHVTDIPRTARVTCVSTDLVAGEVTG